MWSPRLTRLAVAYLLVLATLRVTITAPEQCGGITAGEARRSAEAGATWLATNQRGDGSYLYLADADGRDLGGYSSVRHAGVTFALYHAAGRLDSDAFLAAADHGLAWMLERLATHDGWRALAEGNYVPLGGSALMLAALAERRTVTGDGSNDETMRALGRFLVALQRDDGGFHIAFDLASGRADTEGISQYYAGEATWALARLANALSDEPWERAARLGGRYLATERDEHDNVDLPPLNDHWQSYASAEMAEWPLSDDEVNYARRLFGRFHLLIRWEAQGDAGALYSLTHGPDRRAAALGTWLEGQAALARLARSETRVEDLRAESLRSARCAGSVLYDRQRRDGTPATSGAWFTAGETRMDDQQHSISGLLALAELLDAQSTR